MNWKIIKVYPFKFHLIATEDERSSVFKLHVIIWYQVWSVMIAQWNSSLSVLPVGRAQFPATAEYFKGFFPGWSHSAKPKIAQSPLNDTTQPADSEEEGQCPTMDRWWLRINKSDIWKWITSNSVSLVAECLHTESAGSQWIDFGV